MGNSVLALDNFELLSDTTFLTLQHTESDLTPGTIYRFNVRGRNDAGIGEASNVITIQAATLPGAPEPPTLLL